MKRYHLTVDEEPLGVSVNRQGRLEALFRGRLHEENVAHMSFDWYVRMNMFLDEVVCKDGQMIDGAIQRWVLEQENARFV